MWRYLANMYLGEMWRRNVQIHFHQNEILTLCPNSPGSPGRPCRPGGPWGIKCSVTRDKAQLVFLWTAQHCIGFGGISTTTKYQKLHRSKEETCREEVINHDPYRRPWGAIGPWRPRRSSHSLKQISKLYYRI